MYERAVLRFVRIALGAETNYGGILLIRDNADDAVRRDRLFIEHERDGLTGLNGKRVNLFDIDQRAGMVCRLHRAGEDGKDLQTENARARQQERQQDNDGNQDSAYEIPDFLKCFAHFCPFRQNVSIKSCFCFQMASFVKSQSNFSFPLPKKRHLETFVRLKFLSFPIL